MYCAACGTPITPGLSYCNRCGSSLKERADTKTGAITAFLTAITLIGTIGLGIMLGGAIALRKEANVGEDVMGFFMFLTFFIVGLTEFLLIRQLSKLTGSNEQKVIDIPQYPVMQNELRPAQPRSLAEPVSSVTENTTRTLEYSRNESTR
jgi:hypothetical protein